MSVLVAVVMGFLLRVFRGLTYLMGHALFFLFRGSILSLFLLFR